jgi:hypothetical protein
MSRRPSSSVGEPAVPLQPKNFNKPRRWKRSKI